MLKSLRKKALQLFEKKNTSTDIQLNKYKGMDNPVLGQGTVYNIPQQYENFIDKTEMMIPLFDSYKKKEIEKQRQNNNNYNYIKENEDNESGIEENISSNIDSSIEDLILEDLTNNNTTIEKS